MIQKKQAAFDLPRRRGNALRRFRRLSGACLCAVLLICVVAAGCGAQADAAETGMDFTFSSRDLDGSFDAEAAVQITLADGGSTVAGEGAAVDETGNIITLTEEGTYLVSGSLADGKMIVDAEDTDKLQIVLSGAAIHCEDNAALYIRQADKVFLTLAEGSSNTLSDGSVYELTEEEANIDSVIFSKADLTINGGGILSVTGNYNHGIVSKDDLVITGGQIDVTAAGQGLYGKDCVKIKDGTITLNTGKDAIQSDNSEDENRGFVYIAGGTFEIDGQEDGIQAETVLRIDDGSFQITTGGGSAQAPEHTGEMGGGFGGHRGAGGMGSAVSGGALQQPPDMPQGLTQGALQLPEQTGSFSGGPAETGAAAETTAEEDAVSTKALKAGGDLIINGGSFQIDSVDDAVHANGNVTIEGGSMTASTGDDGVHADGDLIVNDGKIVVAKSYEGMEGSTITINGGTVDVTASDDGFNSAGGSDEATPGRPQDSFREAGSGDSEDSDLFIRIAGGEVTVNASGDGLDSNGDLFLTGGTVTVYGPENGGNGALDYNGKAVVTGGVLMGTGSSGMAQGFSAESSTQYSLLYFLTDTQEAGSAVALTDSSGKAILSWTAQKSFSSVQLSSPELKQGETYTLKAGNFSAEITMDSMAVSNGAGMGGGRGGMGGGRPTNTDRQQPSGQSQGGAVTDQSL